jgi:hypothetical protein
MVRARIKVRGMVSFPLFLIAIDAIVHQTLSLIPGQLSSNANCIADLLPLAVCLLVGNG